MRKKLALHRQTVRKLSPEALGRPVGGTVRQATLDETVVDPVLTSGRHTLNRDCIMAGNGAV